MRGVAAFANELRVEREAAREVSPEQEPSARTGCPDMAPPGATEPPGAPQ